MKPQQQTPPTSTEYVEPLGFKGTPGDWTQRLSFAEVWGNKENATLVSRSKELAKALQDTLKLAEELKFESDKAYQICENAKQVLKQAGLTE